MLLRRRRTSPPSPARCQPHHSRGAQKAREPTRRPAEGLGLRSSPSSPLRIVSCSRRPSLLQVPSPSLPKPPAAPPRPPPAHGSTHKKQSQTATAARSRCGEAAKHTLCHPARLCHKKGPPRAQGRSKISQQGTAGLWEPRSCRGTRSPHAAEQTLAGPAQRLLMAAPRPPGCPRAATDRCRVAAPGPKLPLSQRWSHPTKLPSRELSSVGQLRATAQPAEKGQSGHKGFDTRHQVPGNRNEK